MKSKLAILFIMIYNICLSQTDIDFSNIRVTEARVDSINLYFGKVHNSAGEDKKRLEKLLFEILPNSHLEMSDAMYIDLTKKHIEWEKDKSTIPPILIPHPWVEYLSGMEYYDKQAYYRKYFNICIGGDYGADHMRSGFEIYKRFLKDTKTACKEMKKLNDKEIESIFYFIFDETHPEHNEENIALYKKMQLTIRKVDLKLSELLEKSYKRIIEEQSHH